MEPSALLEPPAVMVPPARVEVTAPARPDAPADTSAPLGLLLQTAQAHQQLVDRSLSRLEAHTQGLDTVVREEIRRTFVAECGALVEEAGRAADALAHLQRRARRHLVGTGALFAALSAGALLLVLWRLMPSGEQLAALRAQRAQLAAGVAQLAASGGRMQLRRCGSARRLCVRVDRQEPAYGEAADYLIVEGY